ncbi:O-antigen ligase family protein [Bosea sp. 2KB_26]|uniref:O-antigen ligase family protein n=1 Tax=Bosea sp. 2KB_26 TaxID=3237475 RepID=UPI003F931293
MLGVATIAFVAAAAASVHSGEMTTRLRRILATPVGLSLAAFFAWANVSILWSHDPVASLRMWGELVLPVGFALAIAASGRFRPQPAWLKALAVAIIFACLLSIVELASGLSQRATLGVGKLFGFVFNRPAITALVLAVPTAHGLWRSSDARRSNRLLAAVLVLAVAALALKSESASARLGIVVCMICWLLSLYLPRLMLAAVAGAFVLTMAMAPVLGIAAENWLPSQILNRFAVMTGQARIDIWLSFGEVARSSPLHGAGFGTSTSMHLHPLATEVSPTHKELFAVGHPHDMPLQAWAETGLIGVSLLTLAGLLLLRQLSRLPTPEMAPRLALFAAAFAIAVVGHGAWQGWWIATLAASILWFTPSDFRAGGLQMLPRSSAGDEWKASPLSSEAV